MKLKHHLKLVYNRDVLSSVARSDGNGAKVAELHPVVQSLVTRHQMLLAPVCTHSRYATLKPLCEPTNDFELVTSAAVPNCNWIVQIGPLLVVVELNLETGRESLALLSANEPEGWSGTLSFGDDVSRFLFFRRPEQRLRFLGNRFPGLKVHSRESGLLQIPPSWFVSGAPLQWVDQESAILTAPKWLLEDEEEAA